jgi:dTDP-4-dehydrorhamnose reductase
MPDVLLVIGGTGMLGHKLAETLAECTEFEVHCSVRRESSWLAGLASRGVTCHKGIHLESGTAPIQGLLKTLRPAIVLNAVGAVKQRDLASSFDPTLFLNGTLPHAIALLNPNPAAKVIHFSTDCVFVGDRGGYAESDLPDAEDLYGRSKAIGEIGYGRHLTIRTSIIGFELENHLSLLSWLFRQPLGTPIRGYSKAIFSGLPTATLSRTVRHLLEEQPGIAGLYHVASQPITKYDLLQRISARFGLDHEFVADPSVRIDRSLDDSRFRALTGTPTPGWDELIEELWQDYQSGPYDDVYRQLRSQTR